MKFEAFSFMGNWTEEQKQEVFKELNEYHDTLDKQLEDFLEQENEARQVYRSMVEY
jgi:hypothetical protein